MALAERAGGDIERAEPLAGLGPLLALATGQVAARNLAIAHYLVRPRPPFGLGPGQVVQLAVTVTVTVTKQAQV